MAYTYDMRNVLWYKNAALEWTEALPLGNGRLGAMMFSGVRDERISLNEDTLWSGYSKDKNCPEGAEYYRRAQDLALAGKYDEAQELIEAHLEGAYSESYLPLGDLRITHDIEGDITDYTRLLDMRSGLSICRFTAGGAHYMRTAFVSYPDQVMVVRIECDVPGKITFSAALESQLQSEHTVTDGQADYHLRAPSSVRPSYIDDPDPVVYSDKPEEMGMRCHAQLCLKAQRGILSRTEDRLFVTGADSAMLIFGARTSFNGFDKQPETEGADENAALARDMDAVADMSFDRLLDRHLSDFIPIYDRVQFELAESADELPTDERLLRFAETHDDKLLYEQIFHYGRYLMISSSRPGTQATNLQGIWNKELRAPWSSNYTININTEMNYWPAEPCAMGDLHAPLFDLIDNLRVNGRTTAKVVYGAGGAVSHHNSDIWGITNPVGENNKGSAVYAFWPMSLGWLVHHMVEHYDYNPDADFLKNRLLPAICDCASFYLDLLRKDADGKYVLTAMTSPENVFLFDGKRRSVARSAAMACAIVYQTLEDCLRLSADAGIENELTARIREVLPMLKQFDIGSKGQLLEWNEEFEEAEPTHRHTSHLWALHPGHLILAEAGMPTHADCPEAYESPIADQPQLADACRRSLELRGDDGTGWSLGWKINHWARLLDGDHAEKLLRNQLRLVRDNGTVHLTGGGTYPNLFDAHPPFQIDGNFGTCAGIAEMFVQSARGSLLLLPALPSDWESGHMYGLCAQGGLTIDIDFAQGKLVLARIRASRDIQLPLRVVCHGKVRYLTVSAGRTYDLRGEDFGA